MKKRGFSLIEMVVVIAILAILSTMLLPVLSKAKRRARAIEEISSARQLMVAARLYADENEDAVFPGYATDIHAKDDRGEPLFFPENARYPWRISPYLAQSFETLYCADNRRKLSELRRLDRGAYVYAVSIFPSLGINAYFMGGNESEFGADAANTKFGNGTVVKRMGETRRPSDLMMFASARSAVTGFEANGYFQITPPTLTTRRWARQWTPTLPPEQWGYVAPRFEGRAVVAMTDGHAQTLNQKALQDMTHWVNTADCPDFILKVSP